MNDERKITVMLPKKLLKNAMFATGEGVTPTLRKGLEMLAAKSAYKKLLSLKGKVDLKLDLEDSRKDKKR